MISKSRSIECRHVEKPGSDEAVKNGCLCHRPLNKDGSDKTVYGYKLTIINKYCALHGKAWEAAPSKSMH